MYDLGSGFPKNSIGGRRMVVPFLSFEVRRYGGEVKRKRDA